MPREPKKLVGTTVERLYIAEELPRKNGRRMYRCECSCGKQSIVSYDNLVSKKQRSCGCLRKELQIKRNTTHGGAGTLEWVIWRGMRARCLYKCHPSYPWYGGKGIKVCERWSNFENFLRDMGKAPGPGYSIERKRTSGDYEPSNCYWLHRKKQNRNKSNNIRVTFQGKTKCLADWADHFGISYGRFYRQYRAGKSFVQIQAIEEAAKAAKAESQGKR